jgi:hypothetical protein
LQFLCLWLPAGNHGACGARTAQEGIGQLDEGWNPVSDRLCPYGMAKHQQILASFSPSFSKFIPTCRRNGQCLLDLSSDPPNVADVNGFSMAWISAHPKEQGETT